MNKKVIILLTVLIDVMGIGIIIPVLPFYVESFGASAFIVTLLFATFSLFSFFSAPLLGSLSDRIGRRPVLIVSIASTALGWLVFAAAANIYWLFIGRVIDGLAAGNFPIAQSYLVDIAESPREKTTNLGLIGAVFGIGLIVGPALGGVLSQVSLSLPFWFVGGLAAFNMGLAFFNLPETNKNRDREKKISFNPFQPIRKAFGSASLRPGFVAWFLFGLALAGQQSVLALYLAGGFAFNSFLISLVMVGTGVILVFNQALFLKKVWLKHFSEEKLIIYFFFVLFLAFLFMSVFFIFTLLMGLVFYSFAQSTLRVVMTSRITKKGDPGEQGMILGVLSSVMSLSMIVGPVLAGALFSLEMNLPFGAGALFSLMALVIIFCEKKRKELAAAEINEEELVIAEQKIEFTG
jgi:DHA1 family tetracycline resistance protein-like MFS transporter